MTANQVQAIKAQNDLRIGSEQNAINQARAITEQRKAEESKRSNRAQEDLRDAELQQRKHEFKNQMGYKWAELPATYLSSLGAIARGAGSLGLGFGG